MVNGEVIKVIYEMEVVQFRKCRFLIQFISQLKQFVCKGDDFIDSFSSVFKTYLFIPIFI